MKRFTTLIAMLALAAAACAGGASPTATPAPVTPAPTATPVTISSAVTWDGQTCTYEGPAAVPLMATVTFTLTNSKEGDYAAIAVSPVQEGTTWEQVVELWSGPEENVWPLFGDEVHFLTPGEAETSPLTAVMTRNLPYLVWCWKDVTQPGGGMAYPAILLNVLKG